MVSTIVREMETTNIDNNSGSPSQLLQSIVNREISGHIIVSSKDDSSIQWNLYLGSGKIHYANSVIGKKERLNYLVKQHLPDLDSSWEGQPINCDYQTICQLWKQTGLSLNTIRQLLFDTTQEALLNLMLLSQVTVRLEKTVGLDPLLVSIPLKNIVFPIKEKVKQWRQLRSAIPSPFYRPFFEDWENLPYANLTDEDHLFLESVSNYLKNKSCIYEISAHSSKTVLEVAQFFQPLVQSGLVTMLPYDIPKAKVIERPIIACIDDSKAIQRMVKVTLESSGYEVLNILEPSQALTTFIKNKPALILMDINMPEIDGYELCQLLQHSSHLKDIPVIMLTGRDGLLDRIRARMVGAVDYMSKPFNPQELISMINSKVCV